MIAQLLQSALSKKNSPFFMTVYIIALLLGLVYSLLVYSPKYTSKAVVLIKDTPYRQNYVVEEAYSATTSPAANPIFNTLELLQSPTIAADLWKKLIEPNTVLQARLHVETQQEWEALFGDGRKFIKAKNPPGTDTIHLTFTSFSPEFSAEALNTLLTSFQNVSRDINQSSDKERLAFLTTQANEIRAKLQSVQQNLAQVKQKYHLLNTKANLDSFANKYFDFKMANSLGQAETAEYRQRLSFYEGLLGVNAQQALAASASGMNPSLKKMREDLYTFKTEEKSLLQKYTTAHPLVQEIQSKIAQTQANIKAELSKNGVSASKQFSISDVTGAEAASDYLKTQSSYKGLSSKSKALQTDLQSMDKQLAQLPLFEKEANSLSSDETILSESLTSIEDKILESKIKLEQTLSNIFIISGAKEPQNTDFPSRKMMIALSAAMAFFWALAAVILKQKYEDLQLLSKISRHSLIEKVKTDYEKIRS